jgi:predicted  nucleic acid-binding Zn-ribbon protein
VKDLKSQLKTKEELVKTHEERIKDLSSDLMKERSNEHLVTKLTKELDKVKAENSALSKENLHFST